MFELSSYVNQAENAVYVEPWHAEIFEFLNLSKNTGDQKERYRDEVYFLWIPDLFMKRVVEGRKWSLMCPHSPCIAWPI